MSLVQGAIDTVRGKSAPTSYKAGGAELAHKEKLREGSRKTTSAFINTLSASKSGALQSEEESRDSVGFNLLSEDERKTFTLASEKRKATIQSRTARPGRSLFLNRI